MPFTHVARLIFSFTGAALLVSSSSAQINTVHEVAPGVYFHEGDPRRGHSNNGWVVCDDFVFVIDANYPSGAEIVMPKVKATSDKPIRFVFDTHHHPDHSYANKLWSDGGATVVANTGVLDEMKKSETGHFGDKPGRWEDVAKSRPDVAATALKPPVVLFPKELFFDDGNHRIELHYFGVAHTHGDGFAWLPKERILFTGDAAVNGPHNYLADATVTEWIKTLEAVKQLDAKIVCPGHGPMGGPEIIVDQQAYFIALVAGVKAMIAEKKTPAEIESSLPAMATELKKTPNIARFVPGSLRDHVARVYRELTGEPLRR